MPRTSDDTLGRRRFQLLRDQAVEQALEKMRHAGPAEWHMFSHEDVTRLRQILGDLWVQFGRDRWEGYVFSSLTRQDIRKILDCGTCPPGGLLSCKALDDIDEILLHSRDDLT